MKHRNVLSGFGQKITMAALYLVQIIRETCFEGALKLIMSYYCWTYIGHKRIPWLHCLAFASNSPELRYLEG